MGMADIQRQDPDAVLILIRNEGHLKELQKPFEERLRKHGVDLSRVVWMPRLPHHQLMALYKLSDVVLDSVYFGGDTTTREAFEVGAPIVTLPHKTIGQRWTQAYYKIIGVEDLIAFSAAEYVRLAVSIARDRQ